MIDPLNKELLLKRFQQLAPMARVAFAAACASRLYPTYELLHKKVGIGDPQKLQRGLDCAWQSVEGSPQSDAECQTCLDEIMVLIQAYPDKPTPLHAYANDIEAAVYYVLHALVLGSVEDPVWVVQRMFEAIGRYVMAKEKLPLKGADLAAALRNNQLLQLEFSRESRDLNDLTDWKNEVGCTIKLRAGAEPALPADLIEVV